MSIGVNLKIDVTKIDKDLLFKGKKGTYLDATVFIDPDNANEYGDHGMITQAISKEAREAGEKGPILGNVKVFWQGDSKPNQATTQQSSPNAQQGSDQSQSGNDEQTRAYSREEIEKAKNNSGFDNFDDDIPF